ncbi:hypothetical protein NQ317_008635 [Molorchus minor]|uniref:Uncharacterized protein n=1 Tax=Molorchus minor TaxID=1323400 RepID=A0ABQ9K2X9_9CUCU|nr:hypothetical protein NQ317_008635 [Molorchus minor]
MGRKIPGKKHRGVRDPEKQAAERFNKIKDKINAPPTNSENQEIPKSLQRIIDLKNRTKKVENLTVNKKINSQDLLMKMKVFSQEIKRSLKEGLKSLCQRYAKNVVKEVAFEEKYGVELKKNEAGEVEDVVKRPKDELETFLKKIKKEKKQTKQQRKKSKQKDAIPKLTKSQKWQLKKKEKKSKKRSKTVDEFETYKDQVKFGEIVHAPPSLPAPRKVEKSQNAPRPGKKNLLLKSITQKENVQSNKSKEKLHKTLNKTIDKNGKKGKDCPTPY